MADPYEYKSIGNQNEGLLESSIREQQAEGWEVVQFYIWDKPLELNRFRCWMRRLKEVNHGDRADSQSA